MRKKTVTNISIRWIRRGAEPTSDVDAAPTRMIVHLFYVVGRASGQVRLRVVMDTKASPLKKHVHQFTVSDCHVYTDEYDSYNGIERARSSVQHGIKEWTRDGDGIREVHTNSAEGLWTGLRNFLRPFRGVHKKYLSGYVAVHECRVNFKRISPAFISALVKIHSFNS